MSFVEIAKKAWETSPHGESTLDGHRVVKDKKMVLVMPTVESVKKLAGYDWDLGNVSIVAFPKPHHFREFERAKKTLAVGGPAAINPGAVGTLQLETYPLEHKAQMIEILASVRKQIPTVGNRIIEMWVAQAHFATSKLEEQGGKSRALATFYNGWRERCLRQALLLAQKLDSDLVIDKRSTSFSTKSMSYHFYKGKTAFRRELEKTCDDLNAEKIESGDFIVIKPPRRR